MIRSVFLVLLSLLMSVSALADLEDGDSYYQFDPVLGVVGVVSDSVEDPQVSVSSEVLNSETFELEEAASVLGAPSPSSGVDSASLSSLAFVHVTSELGVGTVFVPRSYIQSLSINDDGFLCNPLSNSVSGYFKTDDGLIYDINAPSMHPFRYYDTTSRVYEWLEAAPDGGDRNMSFSSGNSPFEDGDQLLFFIAVLFLGVLAIVK